ncbi:MAG TPA: DinB family protein [Vicinamibacterales bacterium]|nr:DinB family protein [Vicinamibacterales bacterium]
MTDPVPLSSQDLVDPWQALDEGRVSLARAPELYRALLSGLPAAALEADEGPGTWTPRQVLCHVLHAETDDWIPRVRILLESGPSRAFTPFDREGGSATYAGRPLPGLLDEFARLRQASLAALDGLELREADLGRVGRHPELGVVTLGQLLACWVTHDWAHLAQISRILARRYGALVGPWKAYFSLLR